jgi:hypothetical protein
LHMVCSKEMLQRFPYIYMHPRKSPSIHRGSCSKPAWIFDDRIHGEFQEKSNGHMDSSDAALMPGKCGDWKKPPHLADIFAAAGAGTVLPLLPSLPSPALAAAAAVELWQHGQWRRQRTWRPAGQHCRARPRRPRRRCRPPAPQPVP